MPLRPVLQQTSDREFVLLFAFLTALTAFSIDAVLPGLPHIANELSPSGNADAHLVITVLVLGMMFGEPIFGPLADAQGRKCAIILGISVFVLGSVVAIVSQSFEMLLLGRFIQGVGVAGPKIGARAAIRDRFGGASMARAMSIIMTVLIVVPMFAPALGELVMRFGGWRTIFIAYCFISIIAAGWLIMRQPESLHHERRIPFCWKKSMVTAIDIGSNVRVLACTVSAGLMFGCLIGYYGIAPSIFGDIYGVGQYFTLLFAVLASGIGIATLTNSRLVMRYGMYHLSHLALIGLVITSSLLLIASLVQQGAPSLIVFMALCISAFFCIGILFGNLGAMAMEPLGAVAGIGASVIASISSAVAVVVSTINGHFYNLTLIPLAGCLCVCALLSLWFLHKAQNCKLTSIQG